MIETLTLFGDSLTAGQALQCDTYAHTVALSGQDSEGAWPELLSAHLENIGVFGPLISSGLRTTGVQDWTFVGTWTAAVSADVWSKTPYRQTRKAVDPFSVATYTRSPKNRRSLGFALYWVDTPDGGNWQYRIDGGAWLNMGQTRLGDNKLCKFYVPTPIVNTLDVRGWDGTANCPVYLSGLELYWKPPTTANGFIVHNVGHGGDTLGALCGGFGTEPGDQFALIHDVRLGIGQPNSPYPTLGCTVGHINDSAFHALTQWNLNIGKFYTAVSPYAPVAYWSPHEVGTAAEPSPFWQKQFRDGMKTTAAGLGCQVLDIFDQRFARGIVDSAANIVAGLNIPDDSGTHQTQKGHYEYEAEFIAFMRNLGWFRTWHQSRTARFTIGQSPIGSSTRLLTGSPQLSGSASFTSATLATTTAARETVAVGSANGGGTSTATANIISGNDYYSDIYSDIYPGGQQVDANATSSGGGTSTTTALVTVLATAHPVISGVGFALATPKVLAVGSSAGGGIAFGTAIPKVLAVGSMAGGGVSSTTATVLAHGHAQGSAFGGGVGTGTASVSKFATATSAGGGIGSATARVTIPAVVNVGLGGVGTANARRTVRPTTVAAGGGLGFAAARVSHFAVGTASGGGFSELITIVELAHGSSDCGGVASGIARVIVKATGNAFGGGVSRLDEFLFVAGDLGKLVIYRDDQRITYRDNQKVLENA